MNQQRHIAIFSAYYPPHLGGVERFTFNLSQSLVSMGCNVTVVTSRCQGARPVLPNVSIIELPTHSILYDRFPLITLCRKTERIISTLQNRRFDAYVVNTRYYPISMLGCSLARKHNITPIVIDHSSGYLNPTPGITGYAMRAYERLATAAIKHFNPDFYCVSSRSAAWLKTFGISASGVIPNSIDASSYIAGASHRDFISELPVEAQAPVIVYAGRLIPEKGVMKTIEAVANLNRKGQRAHLVIAGTGPLQNLVKSAETDHIHYVGPLTQADLSALLSQGDIFCLPTDYPEGLPTVMLEAGAHGMALVISNTGGATEVCPTQEYGIVIDSTSVESIERALLHLLEDTDHRKQLGLAIRERISTEFSWSKAAKLLLSAIDSRPNNPD